MEFNSSSNYKSIIKDYVYKILNKENLLKGEWHLGKVESVISRYEINVFIDGQVATQTIPCNPNIIFVEGDEVWVHFVNGDSKNKFVTYKRATGTESIENGSIGSETVYWSDIVAKPTSSPSAIDDSVAKRHAHENLSLLQSITQAVKDNWDNAYAHVSDTIRHITTSERNLWNSVSDKTDKEYVDNQLTTKVDVVDGKGLSSNDYTTGEKNKLNSVEFNAQVNSVHSVNGKLGEIIITPEEMTKTYTHSQISPSNEWTVVHSLGRYPSVVVVDSAGNEVYGDVQYIDIDTIIIKFTSEFSGMAHLN